MSEETKNQKNIRYFVCTLAALGIVAGLATLPRQNTLNTINQEITATQQKIDTQKRKLVANSPANKANKFDLVEAESEASSQIGNTLTKCLGGFKNVKDFNDNRPEAEDVLNKKLVDELFKLNGAPEEVINSPKNFKFIMKNKTVYQATWEDVNDIHNAKGVFLLITHQKGYSEDNKEIEIENHYTLTINYDLANNKLKSYKLTRFDNPNTDDTKVYNK